MAIAQTSLYCVRCERMTMHQKAVFGVGWGCLLTILTGGLFLPIWIIVAIAESGRPYYCSLCRTPEGLGTAPLADAGKAAYPAELEPPGAVHSDPRKAAYATDEAVGPPAPEARPPHVAENPAFVPPPPEGHQTCPGCRAILPMTAKFCRDCGTPLTRR